MKNIIQVMLVEDHPEYREVIGLALQKEADMELLYEFGTAERALRGLQDRSIHSKPNIILLDLNLPGMSGLEAIPWFKKYSPDSNIIILTQSNAEPDVLQAIQSGASGYLLKSSPRQQIITSIRSVIAGGAPLDAGIARYILNTLQTMPRRKRMETALSSREMDILRLIAEGLAKKEIADRLDISTSTVVTHVSHIYEKLEVPNAPSAVNKAHSLGLFGKA